MSPMELRPSLSHCTGLDETVVPPRPATLNRLICLNSQSAAGGTVWEALGAVALLKKGCHWGHALRFSKPRSSLVSFLSLLLVDWDVSAQLLLQRRVCLLVAMLWLPCGCELTLWNHELQTNFFLYVALAMVVSHRNREVTKISPHCSSLPLSFKSNLYESKA